MRELTKISNSLSKFVWGMLLLISKPREYGASLDIWPMLLSRIPPLLRVNGGISGILGSEMASVGAMEL